MNFKTMLGNAGGSVDKWLIDWRIKGVRGNEQEREQFRKEQFHGARACIAMAVEARVFTSPETSRINALEACESDFLNLATEQAKETGFNEAETAFYVDITRSACKSLAERYRTQEV